MPARRTTTTNGEGATRTDAEAAVRAEVVLFDEVTVLDHLRRRGILSASAPAAAVHLGGGVSSVVLRVTTPAGDIVVKQAHGRLRVAREWFADPGRTVTEGLALRFASTIAASWVPEVVDLDEEALVLVIRAAPTPSTDWKQLLMAGDVHGELATDLGAFIARVHTATRVSAERTPPRLRAFDVAEAFAQLRLRPYFESVAGRDPEAGHLLHPLMAEMQRRRRCLVHGDLSPKNVLCGADLHWLIDWEVAHIGDPAFDVAFLCTHLILKSIHRPTQANQYRRAALGFLDAYATAGGVAPDDAHACALTGALLIARVDGDSPAEYLRATDMPVVRSLGRQLLATPSPSLASAIRSL